MEGISISDRSKVYAPRYVATTKRVCVVCRRGACSHPFWLQNSLLLCVVHEVLSASCACRLRIYLLSLIPAVAGFLYKFEPTQVATEDCTRPFEQNRRNPYNGDSTVNPQCIGAMITYVHTVAGWQDLLFGSIICIHKA